MARNFRTRSVADVDLNQITITETTDELGALEIRIRANVAVVIEDIADPTKTYTINIGVNQPRSAFPGIGPNLVAIKQALLTFIRNQA